MNVGIIPAKHTAKTLLGTLKWLREDPANRMVQVRGYDGQRLNLDGFLAWFRECLFRKMFRNEKPRGRKDCAEWFWQAWRTARDVNTPRLRVRWVPLEFRARLAHRIVGEE